MKEKIDNINRGSPKGSKFEDHKNKALFGEEQKRVRDILRERISNKRKSNMTKINTIKIKKVVNK